MIERRLLVLSLLALCLSSSAQTSLTTFIFVRHAEKVNDGTRDPELSEEGKERAGRLDKMLASQKIGAIYSTNFKRTMNSVQAVAKSHGIPVTTYESLNAEQLKALAAHHKGGALLICGHSNTTPAMINAVLGTQTFTQWDDTDYGNLVMVTVADSGETTVITLRY